MSISVKRLKRSGESGQAVVFVIITLITLIIFVAAVANIGKELSYKVEMQNTADSASIAGAVWEARGLNLISGLNQGIVLSVELIVITVSAIAILGVCAGTLWWAGIGEVCASALPDVLSFAKKAIPRLWKTAIEMSGLEKKIAGTFPFMVPVAIELASGANPGSPVSIPYPYQPSGSVPPPLAPQKISLNVAKGAFPDLIRAIIQDMGERLNKISPLLSKALGILGKSLDFTMLAPDGSIKTALKNSHSYNNYRQAVNAYNRAEEPAAPVNGMKNTKKVTTVWYYITTIYSAPNPCSNCARQVKSRNQCRQIQWSQNGVPPQKIVSDFVNCAPENCSSDPAVRTGNSVSVPLKEKTFCRLDMTVATTTKSDPPAELPFPMKLHIRAEEFLYTAVATTDLGKKRPPVFISNKALLPNDKNPWGFLAFSQAKPQSHSTKPGDVLFEMDWDAHLTRFTALKSIVRQLKLKSSNKIISLTNKLILH